MRKFTVIEVRLACMKNKNYFRRSQTCFRGIGAMVTPIEVIRCFSLKDVHGHVVSFGG